MSKGFLKKIFGFAMTAVTAASLAAYVPSECFAADSAAGNNASSDSGTFDDGTLTYTIGDNYTVSVTGCVSSAISISIQEKIDGYTVTSIGEGAFSNCTELVGLTIPESVETLGEGAFYGCTSLTEITIPSGIKEIPSGTFAYCTALENVVLSEGVEQIDSMAFAYCGDLTDVSVPDTVTSIGDYAFMYCEALKEIEIPKTVTSFTNGIFYGCASLETFTVYKELEDVGNYPFLGCSSLKSIEVEDENNNYVSVDGVLFSADKTILIAYPNGNGETSYTVPEGTTEIASSAFFDNSSLTEINFGSTLQYIDAGAFDFCSEIASLTIPSNVIEIADNAFSDCTNLTEVNLSEGLETVGNYAFYNCENLNSIVIPESVDSIGDYAFGYIENEDETDEDGNYVSDKESGFTILGYSTSKAKKYASKNGIDFQSLNFDMTKIVIIILLVAIFILVAVFVSRLAHKKMMSEEEKKALAEAEKSLAEEAERKKSIGETRYVKILESGELLHNAKGHSSVEDKKEDDEDNQ